MFKVKRFRKIVVKYAYIYSKKPEIIKQDTDYYIFDLKNLIKDVNFQLEDVYFLLEKVCCMQVYLFAKTSNVFWNFIQKIVDYLYDKILYSIEELDTCRVSFDMFKVRAEQVKLFHDNF